LYSNSKPQAGHLTLTTPPFALLGLIKLSVIEFKKYLKNKRKFKYASWNV
jgi:hypothetical protein